MKQLLQFFILVSILIYGCYQSDFETYQFTSSDFKQQLPYLTKGADGQLYLSWIENTDSIALFYFSKWNNQQWSDKQLIAKGTNWFINWADYPQIAVDSVGNKIAHYLVKSGEATYAYDVHVVLKPADSAQWSAPIVIHDDNDSTQTEHGFVTLLPSGIGQFAIAWLDGRYTGGMDHDHQDEHQTAGAMTLRMAYIDLIGNISKAQELDNRVCDCCQTTGILSINGPIYYYRDRSMQEIRDINEVVLINGEIPYAKPVANDNWAIKACPVNGPRAASLNDHIAIAWFTGAEQKPTVKLGFRNVSDASFDKPIIIDENQPLGRVDVSWISDKSAMVSWLGREKDQTVIKVMEVGTNGKKSTPRTIALASASRMTGFPQLEVHQNFIWVAYTQIDDENNATIKILRFR